jgi:hypothetical protein
MSMGMSRSFIAARWSGVAAREDATVHPRDLTRPSIISESRCSGDWSRRCRSGAAPRGAGGQIWTPWMSSERAN